MSEVWSNAFDRVVISVFSGSLGRAAVMEQEMTRVGLSDYTQFWTAPSPYPRILPLAIRLRSDMRFRYMAATLKHQQMVRFALDMGAEHALFLEDDIRFLRDVSAVHRSVAALQSDYDLALFDWVAPSGVRIPQLTDVVPPWIPFAGTDLRSCGCYALSRRGMTEYLKLLEAAADRKTELRICDCYWGDISSVDGFRAYRSSRLPCVQGVPGGTSSYRIMWGNYRRSSGALRDDYAFYPGLDEQKEDRP